MSIVVRYAPVFDDRAVRRSHAPPTGVRPIPADGFDYHVAFRTDGQLLVSEVWDSREQLGGFGKRIMPLLADVALEHSGHPEIFEVYNIIRR